MKKIYLLTLLLVMTFNLFGVNIKEILTYKDSGWIYGIPNDKRDGYYAIHFFNNNEFKIGIINRDTEIYESGIYEISDNKIKLIFNKSFGIFNDIMQEFILHSFETLSCKYFLESKNVKFYNYYHALSSGDVITLNLSTGVYKILILTNENYITTENLNMRSEPSTLSKRLYIREGYNVFSRKTIIKDRNPLQKGSICTVIARTVDKFTINNITDYWYLVMGFSSGTHELDDFLLEDVNGEDDVKSIVKNAWLFGGYLKKKNNTAPTSDNSR